MNASLPPVSDSMLTPDITALLPQGETLREVEPIGGSGSNRQYWRLKFNSGLELIATRGVDVRENDAFIYLSEKLSDNGVNVPRVIAVSPNRMAYIQSSVGRVSLFECLSRHDLIAETMEMLARVQATPGIDWERCYPIAEMDRRSIMWDLNYFKYCFLKTTPGVEIDEPALEDDFERLTEILLAARPLGFMIRDFQSRNVMIDRDKPALIDFQGGRHGPVHYDVASFLWQARANFAPEFRSQMVSHYCVAAKLDESEFRSQLPYFVVFRLLQALGAYGFRGRFEGKPNFLTPIPAALRSLQSALDILPTPLHSIQTHLLQ